MSGTWRVIEPCICTEGARTYIPHACNKENSRKFMHNGSTAEHGRRETQTVGSGHIAPRTQPIDDDVRTCAVPVVHRSIVHCSMCTSSGVSGSVSQTEMPSLGSLGKPLSVQASSQLLVQAFSRHLPAHPM